MAFEWMAARYREARSYPELFEPIWLWPMDERPAPQEVVYGRAVLLSGGLEHCLTMRFVELDVPEELALKSSYGKWNTLVDYCISFGRAPKGTDDWMGLFDWRHLLEFDFVQAIVPYIEREWITSVAEFDEALLRKHGAWEPPDSATDGPAPKE